MRDIVLEETIYMDFTTRAFATGIPTVLAGSPVLSVLEENNATPITAGVSVSVSRASVVGLNMATIVATAANGYELGKGYSVYVSTGTVGGVSVIGEIVAQFTIGASSASQDLANGTDGLGAIKADTAATLTDTADIQPKVAKIPLSDGVITWNSTALASVNAECDTAIETYRLDELMTVALSAQPFATSLFADLTQDDPDNAGTQQFNTAALNRVWDEALTGATHNINNSSGKRLRQVAATIFNEGTAQSGGNNSIQLASGAITSDSQFKRTKVVIIGGTGTGQEAIVTGSTASTDTLTVTPAWLTNPDATSEYEVLPGQAHSTVRNGGYDNGFVYIDVVNGVAGTVEGVNGTTTNKSSVLADARTIADIENIRKFKIEGGGTFLLDQSYTDWIFDHVNASLITLNSKDVSGAVFMRSGITGTGTMTTRGVFELCGLVDVTIGACNFLQCGFTGTLTLSAEAGYLAWDCFENAESTSAPIIDIAGDGATPTVLELVKYNGRIELQNMTSVDIVIITGQARVILNANCSGGTLTKAGDIKLTDNSGNVTINTGNIDDILTDTNELQTDWTNSGRLDLILDSRMAEASINTTGGAVDLVTTNTDMVAAAPTVTQILTTQMTESYAADGVAPTLAQGIFLIQQNLQDFVFVGTTQTVRKLDGSTTAATYTLDDDTNPTAKTRTT